MEPLRRGRWIFLAFAGLAVFYLVAEHRAHVAGLLPFLVIAACPLMHLFMHHGHGGHGGHEGHEGHGEAGGTPREPSPAPRRREGD